jgi:hypothetical protein
VGGLTKTAEHGNLWPFAGHIARPLLFLDLVERRFLISCPQLNILLHARNGSDFCKNGANFCLHLQLLAETRFAPDPRLAPGQFIDENGGGPGVRLSLLKTSPAMFMQHLALAFDRVLAKFGISERYDLNEQISAFRRMPGGPPYGFRPWDMLIPAFKRMADGLSEPDKERLRRYARELGIEWPFACPSVRVRARGFGR